MLRSLDEIINYRVKAEDEELGKIVNFYLDDLTWIIRYMVISTGTWMPGKEVLISPRRAGSPDWKERRVPVNLTSEEIKESPGIYSDLPVSLQKELDVARYSVFTPNWDPGGIPVTGIPEIQKEQDRRGADPHLRSTKEIINYRIEAEDDRVGHVEDFVADTDSWIVRYMVVDTRNWLPGKKVLVAPQWVEEVDWAENRVKVDLTKEQIKNSPEFDPAAPINKEYEARLYDFYGRPGYWE